MNANGNGQINRSNNPSSDGIPVWSPDGTKIAFHSDRVGPNPDIFVMNADGSGQTNRSNNPADDSFPDWQPLSPPPGPPAVGGVAGLADAPDGRASAGASGPSARDYAWPAAAAVALVAGAACSIALWRRLQKRSP